MRRFEHEFESGIFAVLGRTSASACRRVALTLPSLAQPDIPYGEHPMMRLSTMVRVDGMVGPDGSSSLADEVLSRWSHDPLSARFFRSSANFLYTFETAGTPHFLRFADSSERTRDEVVAEVGIVEALASMGVAVATPVRSRSGNVVETVTTHAGTFHAVVFAKLEGSILEVEELASREFQTWGEALGTVHRASEKLPGELVDRRRSWHDDLEAAARQIGTAPPDVSRELATLSAAIRQLPSGDPHIGLIHFDFELDNLVWQDGTIAALDFDRCARYPFVADIAFALPALFPGEFEGDHPSFREFMGGYASVRDPGPTSWAIPIFHRLANLLRYAGIRRAMDLPLEPQEPSWLVALHRKLTARMRDYEHSLAA
jgi:Ser/Thr protein kinase RdoA (MazF antagonist)